MAVLSVRCPECLNVWNHVFQCWNACKHQKKTKNGYDQVTFKWSENGYNYEVRWHTRTPGAPAGQGNTWVVSRVTPGTPTGQVRAEQLQLLMDGYWSAP